MASLVRITNILFSQRGETAVAELCTALDDTFAALEQLTDRTQADEFKMHSTHLPTHTKSLAFVQAVLKHHLAPSKTTSLKSLRDMRSEFQKCLRKPDTASNHVCNLYFAMTNRLARSATNMSTLSMSPTLTARIQLAGWLKHRGDTWGFPRRRKPVMKVSFVVLYLDVIRSPRSYADNGGNSDLRDSAHSYSRVDFYDI